MMQGPGMLFETNTRNQFMDIYDEAKVNELEEIDRLKKLFSLLSHEN
jgi:hypothetical protein